MLSWPRAPLAGPHRPYPGAASPSPGATGRRRSRSSPGSRTRCPRPPPSSAPTPAWAPSCVGEGGSGCEAAGPMRVAAGVSAPLGHTLICDGSPHL